MDSEKLGGLTSMGAGTIAQAALVAIAFRALAAQGLIDRGRAIADLRKILEPVIDGCFSEGGREAARRTIDAAIAVINGEV